MRAESVTVVDGEGGVDLDTWNASYGGILGVSFRNDAVGVENSDVEIVESILGCSVRLFLDKLGELVEKFAEKFHCFHFAGFV